MVSRKSDARKSDVSAVGRTTAANDSSHAAAADDSVLSTATATTGITHTGGDKTSTEGTKKGKESAAASATTAEDKTTIEDLTLPKSILTRLAKGVLPPNTQIQANAMTALSKSTSVFISYLASHANEITLNANKKTIMPADVFKALEEIEFDFLKEPLEAEFAKFNAVQTDKRNTYRQKVKAAAKTTTGDDDTEMGGAGADSTIADTTTASAPPEDDESGDLPRSKKARVEPAAADAEETEADDAEEDAAEEMDDEEEDQEDEEDEEEEEEEEGDGTGSGDETQDALEERVDNEEADEALDGDESD